MADRLAFRIDSQGRIFLYMYLVRRLYTIQSKYVDRGGCVNGLGPLLPGWVR